MTDAATITWRTRLWRWRRLIALIILVLLFRAVLPEILRYVIASQASKATRANVTIGDVDLELYRGGIALMDVAVRERGSTAPPAAGAVGLGATPASTPLPTATPTPATPAPDGSAPAGEAPPAQVTTSPAPASGTPVAAGSAPAGSSALPLIAWKRIATAVRWLPLFHKKVLLRELIIESPRVDLERLASGDFNLLALVPVSATAVPDMSPAAQTAAAQATASPTPSATATAAASPSSGTPATAPAAGSSPWQFGIDKFVLTDGRLRFLDRMVKGAEPVELGIDGIELEDIALGPGVYADPTRSKITLTVDQGTLTIGARARLTDAGVNLETEVQARRMPLRRSRLYVPNVGWSDLQGEVDADLKYQLETGTRNELRGTVNVHDISIHVPQLPEAALSWKRFTVTVDPIDLMEQRANVSSVELIGLALTIALQGGARLPLLERAGASPDATATPGGTPGPTPPAAPAPAPAEAPVAATPKAETKPWHWRVSSLRIAESDAHLLTADIPLDVSVGVNAKDLADAADATGHVDLALAIGSGTLNLAGDVRVQPPAFGGTLKLNALPVPEMIKASGAVPQSPLESATLNTDLAIEAGLAAPGGSGSPASPTDVRVRGTISLADTRVALPGPPPMTTTAKAIDVTLGDLALPGVMALASGAAPAGTPASNDIRLQGRIVLTEPNVTLADRQPLTTTARAIDFTIGDLVLPGLLPGPPVPPEAQAPPAPAGPIRLQGKLALGEPLVTLADGKDFSVGAKAINLGIGEVAVPGVLGPSPADTSQPLRVALGELRLDAPAVKLTRAPEGVVVPGAGAPAEAGTPAPAAQAPAPTAAAPSPPAERAPAAGAPARPLDVKLDSFLLSKGRVQITDRTLKPPFTGTLAPIDARARDIRWPALQVKQLKLSITTPTEGTIDISGDLAPEGGTLDIDASDVVLMPYNPYASHYSPYRVADGALTLKVKVKFANGTYDTNTSLTLHQFDLEGGEGESKFQEQFGVPISMALALMRDPQGDIALDIPVQVTPEGTKIDIMGIAGDALKHALINALASPLKLLGAFTGGDKIAAVAPTIPFRPGRADFTDAGATNAERLATFLKSRPAMAVAIDTSISDQDVRWLREQALLKEWQGSGFLGKVKALTQGDTRTHVEEALEARAKDEPGELSAEDSEALQKWLDERPPIPPEQLHALASARLDKAAAALKDNGIDAARITLGEIPRETSEGAPEAKIQLQPVRKASAEQP